SAQAASALQLAAADAGGFNCATAAAAAAHASWIGLKLAAHGCVSAGSALSALATHPSAAAAQGTADSGTEEDEDDGYHDFMSTALTMCCKGTKYVLRTLPAATLPRTAKARSGIQKQLVEDLQQLQQQLRVALAAPDEGVQTSADGNALAALCPVPLCCNNPSCLELHGASKLQLVAGQGSRCSRCK
ncbi:hypothetical protein COO60DRAFT_1663557, partial [Scenedesmus sp. NREL 46B-D3]